MNSVIPACDSRKVRGRCRGFWLGALALAVYILYNTLFLIPVHFNITHRLIGQGTDPLQWIWFFSWFPYALTHGTNPLLSAAVWAPGGLNLTWTTCTPALAISCWPMTAFWGACVTYNVIVLTTPTLAAWMTYLLCREVTGRFLPALFGGWTFGFSSYELGQLLGHINLISIWPVPMLAWLAVRWYHHKLKDWTFALAGAAALLFLFGSSIEIFATTILFGFMVILIAFGVWRDPLSRHRLARLMILSATIVLAVCVIASPYLCTMLLGPDHPHGTIHSPAVYSTDLANLLIPTGTTWLDNGLLNLLFGPMTGNISEQGAYLGLPLLLMWLLFIRTYRRAATGKLVIFSAAIIFLFSLGPWLTILDHRLPIPLPWAIVSRLPLIQDALPCRFTLYVWLATAVMAAMWLSDTSWHWPTRVKITMAGLTILFLFPSIGRTGVWSIDPTLPAFFQNGTYKHYLYRHENVLLLPMGPVGDAVFIQAQCNFYFNIAGGYLGPPPPRIKSNAVARACFYGNPGAVTPNKVSQFIQHAHIGAVIIPQADAPEFRWLLSTLKKHPIAAGHMEIYLLMPSLHGRKSASMRRALPAFSP